jgi:hypothetical protein
MGYGAYDDDVGGTPCVEETMLEGESESVERPRGDGVGRCVNAWDGDIVVVFTSARRMLTASVLTWRELDRLDWSHGELSTATSRRRTGASCAS